MPKHKAVPAARSADPGVVTWFDSYDDEAQEWDRKCKRLARQIAPFPKAKLMILKGWGIRFGGFQPIGTRTEDIPEGWRLERKHWILVPHKGTPKGKEVAAKIAALGELNDPRTRIPGVPTDLFHFPAVEKFGDEVWLLFGEKHQRGDLDWKLWTPAKLSEWYAAQEARVG